MFNFLKDKLKTWTGKFRQKKAEEEIEIAEPKKGKKEKNSLNRLQYYILYVFKSFIISFRFNRLFLNHTYTQKRRRNNKKCRLILLNFKNIKMISLNEHRLFGLDWDWEWLTNINSSSNSNRHNKKKKNFTIKKSAWLLITRVSLT